MTDAFPIRQGRKLVLVVSLFAVVVVLILAGWYLAGTRFQERMRLKVIAELEQMTGGRVELESFRWTLARLEFDLHGLVIHGLEAPGEAPCAQVDRLLLRLKVLSLIRQRIGISYLEIERPRVHLIVYPDGSTNQPSPRAKALPGAVGKVLFDLGIARMQVERGDLLWNDRHIPLNFSARDLVASLRYGGQTPGYDASLQAGTLDTKYGGLPPLHGQSQAHFTFGSGWAELLSLHLSSGVSSLEAHGSLTDFRDPKIALTYKGLLDFSELGALLRMPELRRGQVDITGQAAYHGREFTANGRLVAKALEWLEPTLRTPPVTLAANYSLTQDHLLISDLTGQGFGGNIFGTVEIVNWNATGAGKREPRGTVHLRLSRVQLGALAAAVSTARLPLSRVNPAGATSGTVDMHWAGSFRNAESRFLVDVQPPDRPSPGQLPVTAHLLGTYRGSQRIFEISQLNMAGRTTRLSASGVLGSTTARLEVLLNSTDLSEVQPVLAAFRAPEIPVQVRGSASFTGSVIGKFTGPTITGHLEIANFDTLFAASEPLLPVSASSAPSRGIRQMHWDWLAADMVYSPSEFSLNHGLLRRGDTQTRFTLNLGLHNGAFEDGSRLRARLNVRGADLQDVQPLLGTDYPLTGKMTLRLTADGTRGDPDAQGHLGITGGSFFGEPFQSLEAEVRFKAHELQFNDLVLSHGWGQVTGSVAYNFTDTGFHFDLRGQNFQLSRIQRLQLPRFSVSGLGSFHLQGSGTTAAPVVNIEAHIRDLLLNKEQAGDFDLTGVTHGADLRLSAHSHFQTAELTIDGDVRLRGEYPANVTLRFSHLDVDPLLRGFLEGRLKGHSSIAGAIDLRGPLLRPRDLNITAKVEQFSAQIEKVRVESDGPIQITLANQYLALDHMHLKGFTLPAGGAPAATPTSDITAGGVIQLGGEHEMNFRADGVLDFGLLQAFNPDLSSSGVMELTLAVTGNMSRPETKGELRITNGAVSYIDLPNGLSNINGTLAFNGSRLQVQSLTAQSGGGTLTLGGFINYSNGFVFNLTGTSKDIRLRYPPGVSASADADVRFTGTEKNSLLSGTVTINRFSVSPQFDLANYLGRAAQAPVMPGPDSPLSNLHFDLHIISARELQVEMSMAKLSGNADLRLRGTASHPVLLGRVDIAQGNIDIAGTKYHLERGDIVFNNPTRIEPIIDIEAAARVRDYDISLGLHGPMSHINVNYRSDPPLATGDIIALLALGRTQEEAVYYETGPNQSLNELASNAILGNAINAAMSSRAQRLFGASRIKIDPQAGGAEANPNARVTIEQQVSDKVTLTFISNLAQSTQQIVQVEYNINRRLSVVTVRDQNGVLSFDVRYRQRKR